MWVTEVTWVTGHMGHGSYGSRVTWVTGHMGHWSHGSRVIRVTGHVDHGLTDHMAHGSSESCVTWITPIPRLNPVTELYRIKDWKFGDNPRLIFHV